MLKAVDPLLQHQIELQERALARGEHVHEQHVLFSSQLRALLVFSAVLLAEICIGYALRVVHENVYLVIVVCTACLTILHGTVLIIAACELRLRYRIWPWDYSVNFILLYVCT